jgi:hypothetical protein
MPGRDQFADLQEPGNPRLIIVAFRTFARPLGLAVLSFLRVFVLVVLRFLEFFLNAFFFFGRAFGCKRDPVFN